jgi:hypothetical protein
MHAHAHALVTQAPERAHQVFHHGHRICCVLLDEASLTDWTAETTSPCGACAMPSWLAIVAACLKPGVNTLISAAESSTSHGQAPAAVTCMQTEQPVEAPARQCHPERNYSNAGKILLQLLKNTLHGESKETGPHGSPCLTPVANWMVGPAHGPGTNQAC